MFLIAKEPRKPGKQRVEMALEHDDLTERIIGAAIPRSFESLFQALFLGSCIPY
jgi:hypothetical protein